MGDPSLSRPGTKPAQKYWQCYINVGLEDQLEVSGYHVNRVKQVFTWLAIILTLGFLRLIFFWRPDWMLKATHSPCHLQFADTVLIEDQYGQFDVEKVCLVDGENRRIKHVPDTPSVPTDAPPRGVEHQFSVDMTEVKMFHNLIRFFLHKNVKYVWMYTEERFCRLSGPENQVCSYFHATRGLSASEQMRRLYLFGYNAIDVQVSSICKLLVTQGLNPFYVFQVFSMVLWYSDQYYWYASTIVIISVVSLTVQIRETRQNQKILKEKTQNADTITVFRDSGVREIVSTEQLVPGDVIEIPRQGCLMHCDAVLVTGNCIVNEAMLTGESMPVIKTTLPNPQTGKDVAFSVREHSRHILFCGTNVLQTRHSSKDSVKAVVIRTGFMTAKGELIRVIMFPKPMPFQFNQESFKWIGCLALLALVGMIYTLVLMVRDGDHWSWILRRTLDLITIVIPPALPAAMTVGIVYAQGRLRRDNIFCINSSLINVSAVIDVFCFDKTGTLTEDGLDLHTILPTKEKNFVAPISRPFVLSADNDHVTRALAACHSLTLIDGVVTGDPLEATLFATTGWGLEEPEGELEKLGMYVPTIVRQPPHLKDTQPLAELGILRVFTFSSNLQRMSVIVCDVDTRQLSLYAKGSPEMIAKLSRPETVPKDFHEMLTQYTQDGFRVLALAHRSLTLDTAKIAHIQREEIERDLTFMGLLVMENKLKMQSTVTIDELKAADMRIVMVTGDNMLTALSVARECHIVDEGAKVIVAHATMAGDTLSVRWVNVDDTKSHMHPMHIAGQNGSAYITMDNGTGYHFAVTGRSWALLRTHDPDLLRKIVIRGAVFARMLPEQKQQLVEMLQSLGYYVGMCGDGANDCGALKTAHTGISVSQADSSVASPFTTKENNIACVPTVIREGRAALVTSFGMFKYMALYSMTQFATVCILYWISANITDFQFLYQDLFLITTLFLTFGYTHAYPRLAKERPTTSLVSMTPIVSMLLQLVVMLAAQVIVRQMTVNSAWYHDYIPNEEDDNDYTTSYLVTTLFCVSMFQYITGAVIFAKSAPFRKTMFSNRYFLVNVIICYLASLYVTVYPSEWMVNLMDLYMPPNMLFRWLIIFIALAHFTSAFILETYVMDSRLVQRFQRYISEDVSKSTKTDFMRVEDELRQSPDWPPSPSPDLDIIELQRQDNALLDAAAIVKVDQGEEGRVNEAFVGDGDVTIVNGTKQRVTSEKQAAVANGNGTLTDVSVN